MSTTHNLEPATARRFVNQLKLLDGKTLQALLSRVEAWKVHLNFNFESANPLAISTARFTLTGKLESRSGTSVIR